MTSRDELSKLSIEVLYRVYIYLKTEVVIYDHGNLYVKATEEARSKGYRNRTREFLYDEINQYDLDSIDEAYSKIIHP